MKYKKIPKEYSSVICDKLTRFKPAKNRFKTLFDDVITKYYLEDNKTSLNDLERAEIVFEIINSSFEKNSNDEKLNSIFKKIEEKTFVKDELSDFYLSKTINFSSIISSLSLDKTFNITLIWLKTILENNLENLEKLRENFALLYPLEGVILCEGQTEYTLLNNIFLLYGIDLNKIGFMIIPAGGKNQVARKYYELIEYLKLPIYILLDNDATETKELIDTKLRKKDKLYLIQSGEFEDLIPVKILKNTINSIHKNDFNCKIEDFTEFPQMTKNLHEIYKKYGYGEFKKAQFAKELNDYIILNCSKADFASSEINQMTEYLFAKKTPL